MLLMIFLTNEIEELQTDGRCACTAMGTILKNIPHPFTFHESILVSLWTFLPNLLCLFLECVIKQEEQYKKKDICIWLLECHVFEWFSLVLFWDESFKMYYRFVFIRFENWCSVRQFFLKFFVVNLAC